MFIKVIIWFIQRYKNPNFEFDQSVSFGIICSLILSRLISRLRALKLIVYLKLPKGLFLGKSVTFFNIKKITFGQSVTIGSSVHLSGLGSDGLNIGHRVNIGDYSRVVVSTSFNNIGKGIKLHSDVAIGEFSYIGGAGGVEIGSSCIIGQYFSIHPENHIFSSLETEIRAQGVDRKGIEIGSNCWIGAKVTILDGSVIGSGCVVAAGAIVNGSFPNDVVIGGVPAKILKKRSNK
jgi:acetyltransferase-like isoleucine patch superfamily enzyme